MEKGRKKVREETKKEEVKKITMGTAVVLTVIILLLLLVSFFFIGSSKRAETKTIIDDFVVSGYADGEFAIKGDPEKTLNDGIEKVKTQMKSLSGELQLQFIAIGSADTTGSSVYNDDRARKRAEQVKEVLLAFSNFPDAKVVAWSKGDAENIKQVRVEYKIVHRHDFFSVRKWIIGVLIIIAVVVLFTLWYDRKISKEIPKPEEPVETRWLDVVVDGRKFSVKIEYGHGKIVSPFKTRSGFKITKGENDLKRMIGSLKGCLRNDEFAVQREILIRCGVIIDKT